MARTILVFPLNTQSAVHHSLARSLCRICSLYILYLLVNLFQLISIIIMLHQTSIQHTSTNKHRSKRPLSNEGITLPAPKEQNWEGVILGDPGADSGGLLIGQKNTKVFWHQQLEVRTAATVWNWSGKTLSPGALLAVLYFSSCHIFPLV